MNNQREGIPFIRKLCKDKTDEELQGVEENFKNYLKIVWQIVQRVQNDSNS